MFTILTVYEQMCLHITQDFWGVYEPQNEWKEMCLQFTQVSWGVWESHSIAWSPSICLLRALQWCGPQKQSSQWCTTRSVRKCNPCTPVLSRIYQFQDAQHESRTFSVMCVSQFVHAQNLCTHAPTHTHFRHGMHVHASTSLSVMYDSPSVWACNPCTPAYTHSLASVVRGTF